MLVILESKFCIFCELSNDDAGRADQWRSKHVVTRASNIKKFTTDEGGGVREASVS